MKKMIVIVILKIIDGIILWKNQINLNKPIILIIINPMCLHLWQ